MLSSFLTIPFVMTVPVALLIAAEKEPSFALFLKHGGCFICAIIFSSMIVVAGTPKEIHPSYVPAAAVAVLLGAYGGAVVYPIAAWSFRMHRKSQGRSIPADVAGQALATTLGLAVLASLFIK